MIQNQSASQHGEYWPENAMRWPSSAIWRPDEPSVRTIGFSELRTAIAKGLDDFSAMPSHALFAVFLYPIVGLVLARLLFGYQLLSLVYPALVGFAFVGPVAAIGLYELSRRREKGLPTAPWHALDAINARSIVPIAALTLVLIAILSLWLWTADNMYGSLLGTPPAGLEQFVSELLYTPPGRQLIVMGNLVGLVFAVVTLAISAVSFPMLVDRDVSAATALRTSVRAFVTNPIVMLAWGAIVVISLLLGAIPLLLGLAIVLPILGHTTWHLYRALIPAEEDVR